jgi:hypothetical protein
MRKTISVLTFGAIATCVVGFGLRRAPVLTPQFAPTVTARLVGEPPHLVVSGIMIHSALGVRAITQTRDGDRITLRVYLRLAQAKDRNDFAVSLKVPRDVRFVDFGDQPCAPTLGALFGRPVRSPYHCGHGRTIWERR